MKAKHAAQIRFGIRQARNILWFGERDLSKSFIRTLYAIALKRMDNNGLRAFKRTLEHGGWYPG